ncbi:MAG: hypothetical protein LAP85_26700 [Acidobacteriia bacterium]|nr:hypothetical protein [Terriglobia bacterium]
MGRNFKELLNEWRIPDPPAGLDTRMAATYEKMRFRRMPVWLRPVRLPAPVLALLLILQAASMAVIGHFLYSASPAPILSMPEKVITVPVVREKVVTQIVYLPAVSAGSSRERASHATAALENEDQPMELTGFRPVAQLQLHVIKGDQK